MLKFRLLDIKGRLWLSALYICPPTNFYPRIRSLTYLSEHKKSDRYRFTNENDIGLLFKKTRPAPPLLRYQNKQLIYSPSSHSINKNEKSFKEWRCFLFFFFNQICETINNESSSEAKTKISQTVDPGSNLCFAIWYVIDGSLQKFPHFIG